MWERESGDSDTKNGTAAGDPRHAWGKQRHKRMAFTMKPFAPSDAPPSEQRDAP